MLGSGWPGIQVSGFSLFFSCDPRDWFQSLCFLVCKMDIIIVPTIEWDGGPWFHSTHASIAEKNFAISFQEGNLQKRYCQFLCTSSFIPLLGVRGFISLVNLREGTEYVPWSPSSLPLQICLPGKRAAKGLCPPWPCPGEGLKPGSHTKYWAHISF